MKIVAPADVPAAHETVGALAAVDTWLRDVIAAHHPVLKRTVCPFVAPAMERGTLFTLFGHAAFQHLNAACELGLHELLHEHPDLSAQEIANRLALSDRAVGILPLGTTALYLRTREDLFRGGAWSIFRDLVEFEAHIVYLSHSDYAESLRQGTNVGLRWFPGAEPDLCHRLENAPEARGIFFQA